MNTSAIILTGGQSQRMGTDKALLRISDQTFLSLIAHKLASLTDDIVIAGTYREGYAEAIAPLPVRFVPDSFENRGPLGGLHAGLQTMRHPVGIVVACDMPLINIELLRRMVERLDIGTGDAVVPQDEKGWHPLHAIYRKRCVTPIEHLVRAGDLRVQNLIKHLNVQAITQNEMAQFDPHGLSLKNLNTPDEVAALLSANASLVLRRSKY